jgi:thiol-disulfide isomerase/thioredoxin
MRIALWLAALMLLPCFAQDNASNSEQEELRRALAETGGSSVDFIRVLENHLAKYPDTQERPEIERALVKAAIDAKDDRRILRYGERVLEREPDDLILLEKVTRILLSDDDKDNARKALDYARRYEAALRKLEHEQPPSGPAKLKMREQLDRSLGKALVFQARATGNLGDFEGASTFARHSYEIYPTAESAREIGRWLSRLGKDGDALEHFADAFAIADPDNTEPHRAADRARLRELYLKNHDSETGLGDLILEAYDRTSVLLSQRRKSLTKLDPNANVTDPMEFTLSGLDGASMQLAAAKGKVVVLDFWATWCAPCRVQHPLYEEVKEKFSGRDDVVFLNINTDEDRDLVAPFLERNNWKKTVYFEDGLSRALKVYSIPTTIIVDKRGEIASRMNGFIPERFVEMLTERIEQTLATN